MADSSFDIVSKIDRHEVDNALNQAAKEIGTRFDFRNVGASISWSGERDVDIRANSEERAAAVLDVFKDKLVRRGVSLKVLDAGEPRSSGKEYRLAVGLREGISADDARKISKIVRDEGPSGVRAQVQGDGVRVSSKKKDDLQAVIALLKGKDLDVALQFVNYRLPGVSDAAWRAAAASPDLWHHRWVSSSGLEHLARTAYEAHRGVHPVHLPPWEQVSEEEKQAWIAAVSAVTEQPDATVAEALPSRPLVLQLGERRHTFHADFSLGRQGNLVVNDEFASGRHARCQLAHGVWFLEDLGSTNGTRLNKRRIHGPQRLKKGDKIQIGHTVMTVASA